MLAPAWNLNPAANERRDPQTGVALPAGIDYAAGQAPGPSTGVLDQLARDGMPWTGPELPERSGAGQRLAEQRLKSGPGGIVFPWFASNSLNDGSFETQSMRNDYRRMSSEPNISAAIKGLIYSVAAQDLKIAPENRKNAADQEIAAFSRWQFDTRLAGGVPGMVWGILWGGLVDGYSLNYKVWGQEDRGKYKGQWVLRMLQAVDVDNDAVLETDSRKNVVGVKGLRYNAGDQFSPSDFIIYRHCPAYNNPRGTSALRCVHRAWQFLTMVVVLRGVAAEKRAIPFVWGSYKTASQQQQLESMLKVLKSQNWAAVPEGVQLAALEIAGGSEEMFRSFCSDLQEWIFIGIQHATLQTLTGEKGVHSGNSKVHKSQADLVRWFLSVGVEACLNDYETGLLKDVVELNYGKDAAQPKGNLSNVEVEEMLKEAQLDGMLQELGLQLSRDDSYDKYALTPPENPEDVLEPREKAPTFGSQAASPGVPGERTDDVSRPGTGKPSPTGRATANPLAA